MRWINRWKTRIIYYCIPLDKYKVVYIVKMLQIFDDLETETWFAKFMLCVKNHSLQNHVLPLIYTLSEITWNPIWMKRIETNNKWYCQNIQISWELFDLVRIALCQRISNHTWLKSFSPSYVLPYINKIVYNNIWNWILIEVWLYFQRASKRTSKQKQFVKNRDMPLGYRIISFH